MNIRALSATLLFLSAAAPPERSAAYSGESEIGYDTETVTLSGYSRTWKDPADWDFDSTCIFWDYDIDFGFYCSRYHLQYTVAAVFGEIYRQMQSEPVASEYSWGDESARTDYSTTFPAGDLWRAQAEHFIEVDHYLVFCSLTTTGLSSCSSPFHVGTTAYLFGETVDREPVCGEPEVDEIYREYRDGQYMSTIRPECEDFSNSGDSTNFTWSQLNGGFTNGNPHRTNSNPVQGWGMVTQNLKNGLDYIASNYADFEGIVLTSGYRCPHGNADVNGEPNSFHTHGRAADLDREWTEAEFNRLRTFISENLTTVELLSYDRYPDHHLHVAF